MSEDHRDRALTLLSEAPGRVTRTRIAVLACLLASERPLSHAEVQAALPDMDRVSIYRILDWLGTHRLAERVIGTDGLRRYAPREDHAHPHFSCTACGTILCLHDVAVNRPDLPRTFQVEDIAVTIRGVCPDCR